MGFHNLLKDIFLFTTILPPFTLFLLSTFIFSIWKTFVFLIVFIIYRKNLRFLAPLDLYFISLESSLNFHGHPRKVLPITLILEGDVGEAEVKERFQKEVIDFRDEKGNVAYERLQQRLVKKFGYIFFTRDENFSTHNHIRTVEVPLTEASVLDFIKAQTPSPFQPDASMWEIILVPNFNGENKTFLFLRVHHAFMDGFSVLSIFKRGCENGDAFVPKRTAAPATPTASSSSPAALLGAIYQNTIALPRKYIQEQRSRRNLKSKFITKDFFLEKTPRIPLSKFKTLKAETDVTFTLAITTAISSALSEAMVGRAIPLLGLDYITGMITFPASVGAEKDVGNSFILADVNLPLRPMTLQDRIEKCREEMVKTRSAVSPKVNAILGMLGNAFPASVFMKYFVPSMSEEEGICISNMPGPQTGCKFWGRDVVDMSFSVIACENPWLTVSILSYDGAIRIGLTGIAHVFETEKEFQQFTDNFMNTLDAMFNHNSKV